MAVRTGETVTHSYWPVPIDCFIWTVSKCLQLAAFFVFRLLPKPHSGIVGLAHMVPRLNMPGFATPENAIAPC